MQILFYTFTITLKIPYNEYRNIKYDSRVEKLEK